MRLPIITGVRMRPGCGAQPISVHILRCKEVVRTDNDWAPGLWVDCGYRLCPHRVCDPFSKAEAPFGVESCVQKRPRGFSPGRYLCAGVSAVWLWLCCLYKHHWCANAAWLRRPADIGTYLAMKGGGAYRQRLGPATLGRLWIPLVAVVSPRSTCQLLAQPSGCRSTDDD